MCNNYSKFEEIHREIYHNFEIEQNYTLEEESTFNKIKSYKAQEMVIDNLNESYLEEQFPIFLSSEIRNSEIITI